jgi:hypothetical protein
LVLNSETLIGLAPFKVSFLGEATSTA